MDAVDDIVLQAVGSERAAVADAVLEDAVGVAQAILVLPGDLHHVEEVPGLGLLPDAEGEQLEEPLAGRAGKRGGIGSDAGMGHGALI